MTVSGSIDRRQGPSTEPGNSSTSVRTHFGGSVGMKSAATRSSDCSWHFQDGLSGSTDYPSVRADLDLWTDGFLVDGRIGNPS